jgi:anti-anti-sigma factor
VTLRIETSRADSVAHIRLIGEFDLESADRAEQSLSDESLGDARVLLDLRGLEFMDSTGLRVILAADERARRRGTGLVIVRGPATVHRLFVLTGLEDRLTFVDDPTDALPA